jgi:hypothetical protein
MKCRYKYIEAFYRYFLIIEELSSSVRASSLYVFSISTVTLKRACEPHILAPKELH